MGPWLRSHGRRNHPARMEDVFDASMGPWLRSHGRTVGQWWFAALPRLQWGRGFAATEGGQTSRRKEGQPGRFNGAVASQPRKAPRSCSTSGTSTRFNGAVASQPRKVRTAVAGRPSSQRLQWGRGFAATEGWRRTSGSSLRRKSFNGAVASQPRKDQEREDIHVQP